MSGKLDQSLDDITSAQRRRGRTNPRRATRARAPVGGIQKKTKVQVRKPIAKTAATAPAIGPTKITVSNLPTDVTKEQIKKYFRDEAGPIKSVDLDYNEKGDSRGRATIVFRSSDATAKAIKLDGILVDKKPIKVEVHLLPGQVEQYIPAAKSLALADRATQPKNKPKSAVQSKPKSAIAKKQNGAGVGKTKAGAGQGAGKAKARNTRPVNKKKTAEELDAEMAGYFDAAPEAPAVEGAAPASAAMEEDIM